MELKEIYAVVFAMRLIELHDLLGSIPCGELQNLADGRVSKVWGEIKLVREEIKRKS